jgi:acylphosphatase
MSSALRAAVHGVAADDVLARARDLGLLGWVRTDDDGVRVHAEGDDEAVEALRAFLGDDVEETKAKVEGHEQLAVRGVPAGAFLVREHERGFELTLEVDGEPRIWAVPKGPSMDPADKRFAVVADAPVADAEVWDQGVYEQGGRVPWPEAIERGHAVFVLHGEKLRGGFGLQRTGRGWLLVKRRDEHAVQSP